MTYDEIFNRFYNLMDDPNFYKLPQDFAYDRICKLQHRYEIRSSVNVWKLQVLDNQQPRSE